MEGYDEMCFAHTRRTHQQQNVRRHVKPGKAYAVKVVGPSLQVYNLVNWCQSRHVQAIAVCQATNVNELSPDLTSLGHTDETQT